MPPVLLRQHSTADWGGAVHLQPLLYVPPLVRVAIREHDGIVHALPRDRAIEGRRVWSLLGRLQYISQ